MKNQTMNICLLFQTGRILQMVISLNEKEQKELYQ